MIKTTLFMPPEIADQWHILKGYVSQALNHGVNETPIEEWLKRLLAYQAQMWVVTDDEGILGVCVTQFIDYVTHRTLHIVMLSGDDYAEWATQMEVLYKFAKENNCKAVELWGRPGWSRVLPKYSPGFETVYHVMRKELF